MDENYLKRDIENLKKIIHEMGFAEIETELLKFARPSIRVETTAVENEDELAIGQSKIGGRPDLPRDMDWVQVQSYKGIVSLQFVAQINLADVKTHDVENLLPDTGILYFFGDPWRAANKRESAKVIYYNGDKFVLVRKSFPKDLPPTPPDQWGDHRYDPCLVKFIPEVNLNSHVNLKHLNITWDDYDKLVYASSYSRKSPFPWEVNRMLGFNHDVPSDMPLDCQLIADTGSHSPNKVSSDEKEAAEKKKSDWHLLFQLDSDDNANMAWSDMGTICFYIRKQDLQAKNFNNVCLAFFTS